MQLFITTKALEFFPSVGQGTVSGRSYFKCQGEPVTVPAGHRTATTLDQQAPGRWLVKAEGAQLFRFAGLDELRAVQS